EEFLIILPNCDQACGQNSGQRLISVFEQNKVVSTEATFSMTLSLGAVVVEPGSDHLLDDIIGTADEALYKAKENGRNRIEFAQLR
ncbi:MAG: GGDEF domain-containing protein, partial [Syntrophaceae bacterium]|nr:GGDEF domain-containing protein [Syntrophaceae bacterium]